MKKRITSFSAGFLTAVLLLALGATALAASGKVSYNFANVALNGETKITAGADITAANGQKVPGTILFTDNAGGKTNYLPIRAVSELLGVEIGYDSATKTVLLGGQPVQPAAAGTAAEGGIPAAQAAKTVPGRQWQREVLEGYLYYTGPAPARALEGEQAPAWHPAWLPEGSAVDAVFTNGVSGSAGDTLTANWNYSSGLGAFQFSCFLRPTGNIGAVYGAAVSESATLYETKVNGYSADFYEYSFNGKPQNDLVWENECGNLLWLRGSLDRDTMVRIAESVTEKAEALPEYQLAETPAGSSLFKRTALPGIVSESWHGKSGSFTWTYSSLPLSVDQTGTVETVEVNGVQAQFWQWQTQSLTAVTKSGDGEVLSSQSLGGGTSYTLLWTDPQTKINFRLEAPFDKDTMIRMAESVTSAASQPAAPSGYESELEKRLEEARKVAYQDLDSAPEEMKAKILAARKLIINNTSWVADGYNGSRSDPDGNFVSVPHFSELFPGWDLPKA